jgi:hypothetical protein
MVFEYPTCSACSGGWCAVVSGNDGLLGPTQQQRDIREHIAHKHPSINPGSCPNTNSHPYSHTNPCTYTSPESYAKLN